jgi:hypothetical protein
MVVAFDSYRNCYVITNIDYSGILSWAYQNPWGLRGESLQMNFG